MAKEACFSPSDVYHIKLFEFELLQTKGLPLSPTANAWYVTNDYVISELKFCI